MDVFQNGLSGCKPALSERQHEVLDLVSRGYTSKEIARTLGISPSTVDNHIKAAIDKLGARNRQEAARLASADLRDPGPPVQQAHSGSQFSIWRVPGLSSDTNGLTRAQKLAHIVQISVLSVIAISAAILTITGVVYLLPE